VLLECSSEWSGNDSYTCLSYTDLGLHMQHIIMIGIQMTWCAQHQMHLLVLLDMSADHIYNTLLLPHQQLFYLIRNYQQPTNRPTDQRPNPLLVPNPNDRSYNITQHGLNYHHHTPHPHRLPRNRAPPHPMSTRPIPNRNLLHHHHTRRPAAPAPTYSPKPSPTRSPKISRPRR
jgi:hypothetical protein